MISQNLYNGEVEMRYDPIAHMYTANGIVVPSVTKVVGVIDKPALIYWAVNETIAHIKSSWKPDETYSNEQIQAILADAKGARFRTSQKALNIGSDAHDWVERYIKSKILNTPLPELPEYPPVLNAVNSYIEWEKDAGVEYISSERRLYSVKYAYSGTVDITMRVNDEVVVADLKTSKGIYPEYYLQCAAYASAIEEEDGIDVKRIAIIRIPKDGGEVEVEESEDLNTLFGVFRACLAIWRWKNNWNPEDEKWTRDYS